MTDAQGADDAALAAYARRYALDMDAAAAEWRFMPECDRERWRGSAVARAHQVLADLARRDADDADPGDPDGDR